MNMDTDSSDSSSSEESGDECLYIPPPTTVLDKQSQIKEEDKLPLVKVEEETVIVRKFDYVPNKKRKYSTGQQPEKPYSFVTEYQSTVGRGKIRVVTSNEGNDYVVLTDVYNMANVSGYRSTAKKKASNNKRHFTVDGRKVLCMMVSDVKDMIERSNNAVNHDYILSLLDTIATGNKIQFSDNNVNKMGAYDSDAESIMEGENTITEKDSLFCILEMLKSCDKSTWDLASPKTKRDVVHSITRLYSDAASVKYGGGSATVSKKTKMK